MPEPILDMHKNTNLGSGSIEFPAEWVLVEVIRMLSREDRSEKRAWKRRARKLGRIGGMTVREDVKMGCANKNSKGKRAFV